MHRINTDFPLDGFMESRIGGRAENQDACGYTDTPFGVLLIVCDGMGGMQGGSIASSLAVQTILGDFNKLKDPVSISQSIHDAVNHANKEILAAGSKDVSLSGMGTTLTLLLLTPKCAYTTHLGDSRVYQLRRSDKVYRSQDDSVVFQMVRNRLITEEQARVAENSNIITKALGIKEEIDFEVEVLPYDKGDRFLLCTDGFWGNLPEKEFLHYISRKGELDLVMERTCGKIEKAGYLNKNGQHDNFTCVAVDVKKFSKLRSKMEKIFKYCSIALLVLFVGTLSFSILNNKHLKDDIKQEQERVDSLKTVITDLSEQKDASDKNAETAAQAAENARKEQAAAEKKVVEAGKEKAEAEKKAKEAEKEKAEAEKKAKEAVKNQTEAEKKAKEAEKERAEAEQKAKEAVKNQTEAVNKAKKEQAEAERRAREAEQKAKEAVEETNKALKEAKEAQAQLEIKQNEQAGQTEQTKQE